MHRKKNARIIVHSIFYITIIIMSLGLETIYSQIPDQIRVYKTIDTVDLKIHIFNPPTHNTAFKVPVIVFFFGGGWNSGKPEQFYKQCEYLSSRGMVAISAEYRINNVHGTSPKESVTDGKSTIRWIRKHADELGIDPNKIAAGGGSAGGHVAAAAGTVKFFDEENEEKNISSKPNALVLYNPVIDNGPDGYGYERVKDYWQEFSPMNNIDQDTPPTIFFLGTMDKLIAVQTAEKFKKIMEENRVRCDLFLYENEGHGFFNKKRFTETLFETDKFLQSLGYIKGEPTLKIGNN